MADENAKTSLATRRSRPVARPPTERTLNRPMTSLSAPHQEI
jgi:hypothetical protein